ncbi:ABC transporter ATP-binding protein [Schaalia sp. ZJ1691]|uniref:ABC transporter ATP-binding protein n=1 Tax=Schaalia sp. ZJ1691 TaxID=2709404 RepID=UPI0013EB45E8|nr:ABC transporter ATP-binding protein [Schaalia sp. ZJ1691]
MRLPIADGRTVIGRMGMLLRSYRWTLTTVIVLQLGASGAAIILPWMLGTVIDRFTQGTVEQSWLIHMLVIAIVLVAVASLLSFIAEYRARVLGEKLFARLRDDLVHSVTHLSLSVVEAAGTGDLLGRTTHDIGRVQYTVRQGISRALVLATTIIVTLVAAFSTQPLLAVLIVAEFPVLALLLRWYLPRTIPSYRAGAASWARMSGSASETLENADTVEAARLGRLRKNDMDASVVEMFRLERYGAWARMFLLGGLGAIVLVPVILIVLVGALGMSRGWMTLGQVTTVALYALQIRMPVNQMTFWIDQFQASGASLARIFGVALVDDDRQALAVTPDSTVIVASDVSYAYREGEDVLHGVNLELRDGETLAIVGPSGAGKSTLGRMIAGIHAPTSGAVTVGGVPLVDLPEDMLHRQVALVTQEHHVFVGSIAHNLKLAAPDATDEDMWRALEGVEADAWVRDLPEGLDTVVGTGGLELSPARAQQLALARIILLDPHTLVLDEATSLLDPASARSLEKSLGRVLEGRTVVAIAHRLHTAHDADRVAVMVDGRIAELGSHDELVALGGEYARLWEAWRRS